MSATDEVRVAPSTVQDVPLLRVRDMDVRFDTSRGQVRAVSGVSFELRAGRTLGLVGESGSGKSVLCRGIMGILGSNATVADHSQVVFEGRALQAEDRDAEKHLLGVEMAMIFQDPMTSLTPSVRIGRQIAEPLRYHLGLTRAAATVRAVELLEAVGVPDPTRRLRDYPHNLSGGLRQRVMIAIALSCSPKLLFADEATTALDVTIQQQILNLLERVKDERHMAMVFVSHDLGVVAGRTDETAVMYAGKIVERAPTRSLFGEMRHPYTHALVGSIPRITNPSHTRLQTISGRPPVVIDPPPGCSFAPRCRNAQPRCLAETPPLESTGDPTHQFACFFPVGTTAGDRALAENRRAGRNAAGMRVGSEDPAHGG